MWRISVFVTSIVAAACSVFAWWQGLIMWIFPAILFFWGDYLQAEYRGQRVKG